MEKLTLEHLSLYLPYHLKGNLINDEYYEPVYAGELFRIETGLTTKKTFPEPFVIVDDNEDCIEYFTPILRPMDLTKPIIIQGKEIIPINLLMDIELDLNWSDSEYLDVPQCNKCLGEINSWTVFKDNLKGASFGYSSKGYFYHLGKEGIVYTVKKQKELFRWLYANKFDVDGLIEMGLAINADTLKVNPYNN